MKGCVHGSLLDISIEDVMKLSADRPMARYLSQKRKIGLPRLMQSFKTYSLPKIVCSLRPPACLCAKCDAVHSRAPDCMRFVTAQRFQIVLESFFYRFPCPSHPTLHYACGPFSDRFFIVFLSFFLHRAGHGTGLVTICL